MNAKFFRAALPVAMACSLVSFMAQAQTATDQSGQLIEEVVTTGSRVITNGNDAPTPVTVVTPEQVMATKPTTLYENLVDMPVFSGSRGASNGPVSNTAANEGAVNSLNLRNMAPRRTLVLFDGNRVPATTPDGLVDAGALPQMLIRRVEVVTGGASAVYGSDAVTGVVNFITDTSFEGIKVNLRSGISAQSDAETYDVGVAVGHELSGGRGHIEASFQRHDDDGLYSDERDWATPRWTVQGNGGSIPWHLQDYVANASASYGGAIACKSNGLLLTFLCPSEPLVAQSFNTNGFLSAFDPGLRGAANGLGTPAAQIGGDGVYFNNVAIKSASRTDQYFVRYDYDISDDTHFYIAGSGGTIDTHGNIGVQRSFPPGWKLGACNPFLSAQYQDALGCVPADAGTANEATFAIEKAFDPEHNYGVGQNNKLDSKHYFIIADLDGSLGENYNWEVAYTHSQSKLNVFALNQNRQHIYAAIDPAVDGSGNVVCRAALTNPSKYSDCVPINLFGPTSTSKEAMYYMFDWIRNSSTNTLDGLSGSITGSPLDNWAGPIDMAFSAEFRKQSLKLTSTSRPDEFLDCTDLRFGNCNPTAPVHANGWLPIPEVNQTISEGAFEFNMPLVESGDINFNGAARFTRYQNDPNNSDVVSRTFNATTWKAGVVWDVNEKLTLRVGSSRDIRAPSLYDLYLPDTIGNVTFAQDYLLDPGGVQIFPRPKNGGNPFLDPEVGRTTTFGIVYQPIPSLSISLDAYDIKLTDALYSLNGAAQPSQQACYDSGGSSPLCQLQERPNGCCSDTSAANAATAFYTRNVNIAEQDTKGVDMEVNFNTDVKERALSLRTLVTYQPHIYYHLPDLANVQDAAGVAYPRIGGLPAPVWKATLFVSYDLSDRLGVDASVRYRSSLHWTSDPDETEQGGVPSVSFTNVNFSYDVPMQTGAAKLFFNVQNVFDKDPPPAGTLGNIFPGSYPGVYAVGDDAVGRYYTAGINLQF